jgi:Putative zinc-finger
MSADDRCDEARELISELALGVADGEERARVLEHVEDCPDCRRELERQSAVADSLLVLAPEQEPPPGFELKVLRSIQPPAPRRSILRPLAAVGAVAAAVAITVGAMLIGTRDDRRLADQYRAALEEANGRYFSAAQLTDPAGRRGGVLFTYRGTPSWILVTVSPALRASVDRAELVDRGGNRIPLPSFRLADGAWGGSIPVDLQDVAAVHLVGEDGRAALVAELPRPANP